jgi:hypothetical protein
MAGAFLGRRPALRAAALCAISPLVLEYAQQVRVYVFAMLAVTVAVGATLRATQQSLGRRTGMLGLGALAAVLSLWLHYTTLFAILPLCVWLARRTTVPRRARLAFIAACAIAEPLIVPRLAYQDRQPAAVFDSRTWGNLLRVVGTPFDGRFAVSGVGALQILAAAVVLSATITLLAVKRKPVREPHLLAAVGLLAPVAICVAALAGQDVLISRYTAIARLLHPLPPYLTATNRFALLSTRLRYRRLWIVSGLAPHRYSNGKLLQVAQLALRPLGYRPIGVHAFTG